jgi:adenylosuccinate synthase
MIERGINILIDGQFGSTGKGLFAGYLAKAGPEIAVSTAAPNAGHTFRSKNPPDHIVAHHLPISGILNKNCVIYLSPASVIDPPALIREMHQYQVDPNRVIIHPRAAVVTPEDVLEEHDPNRGTTFIASTRHGVGAALARKIRRIAALAEDTDLLRAMVGTVSFTRRDRVLVEVPQGFSLGINSGRAYPFCTSREITVSQTLADIQAHPRLLANVFMTLRTFPIRVGHIFNDQGEQVGDSGPWYTDQKELSWQELGQNPEYTTVTNRMRRVATFSYEQLALANHAIRPTHIFLNFINYFRVEEELIAMLRGIRHYVPQGVTHLGTGPNVEDVWPISHYRDAARAAGLR